MTDDETEETVMVTRRDRRRAGRPADAVAPVDAGEEQVSHSVDEATLVVDRSGVPKADSSEEATVVVSRPMRRSRRRGDRGLSDPAAESASEVPASESFSRTTAPTPALYKPRPAPISPAAPPIVVGAAASARVIDPEQPSVTKQARRWSVLTLSALAAACAVSAAGLVALGFVILG